MTNADQIDLINVERGKYFRIVADVAVDGVDLAGLLIEAALAVAYEGKGPKYDWCQ